MKISIRELRFEMSEKSLYWVTKIMKTNQKDLTIQGYKVQSSFCNQVATLNTILRSR